LLRLGQGLRDSLIGTSENRGLFLSMSLRRAEVVGDRARNQRVCVYFQVIPCEATSAMSMVGRTFRKMDNYSGCVQMLSLLLCSSKRSLFNPFTSSFYMGYDAQGTLHAQARTLMLRPVFQGACCCYHTVQPSFLCICNN